MPRLRSRPPASLYVAGPFAMGYTEFYNFRRRRQVHAQPDAVATTAERLVDAVQSLYRRSRSVSRNAASWFTPRMPQA